MKLGTGLFTGQRRPSDDRSFAAIYDEIIRLARTIDEVGLASAWVSEHHFADDGYLPGTMPTLGAIAAATDDVELGTCIGLAPLYDAIRLAEDGATLSLLSGGRATLGLAIGYREREFEGFGVPKSERASRTEDAVKTLHAAWSEGPLDYDPAYHPAPPDLEVTPTPDSAPPIVLGGGAKPAVRRAARLADGWVAPSSLSVDDVAKRVADIRSVREDEGHTGEFQVYVLRHGFVAADEETAWNHIEEGYRYLQRRYAEWYGGEPVSTLPTDRVQELREDAILGPPEVIADELQAYRDAVGDDVHVILRTYYPGIGTDRMATCIRRLGEDVQPRL
jgi:alkanesulfonate monooxygenase SsuD/methylene tetrahydromethanopterin reductase-like flavin-dependent oxidoreductase (luciferase family)